MSKGSLSLHRHCYFCASYSDFNMFVWKGKHWPPSHSPLYPGLTLSGALSTTAYWKFLRTDPRQGSCYEWVGCLCNPPSCDLTSCLSQSLSHVDESFPPTHGSLIRKHIHRVFFKHPAENCLSFLFISLWTLFPVPCLVAMVLKGTIELCVFSAFTWILWLGSNR